LVQGREGPKVDLDSGFEIFDWAAIFALLWYILCLAVDVLFCTACLRMDLVNDLMVRRLSCANGTLI
jgi:hypothetical protein